MPYVVLTTVYLVIYLVSAHGTTKNAEEEFPSIDACKEAIRKNTFRHPSGNNWYMRCEDFDPDAPTRGRGLQRNIDPTPIIR